MTNLNYGNMTPAQRLATYVIPKSRTIPVFRVKLLLIGANIMCTALVVYGTNLGSTIGFSLTAGARNGMYLTPLLEQILVGILLGDGSIRRPVNENPIIVFKQGFIHLDYILHLALQLSPILTQ